MRVEMRRQLNELQYNLQQLSAVAPSKNQVYNVMYSFIFIIFIIAVIMC